MRTCKHEERSESKMISEDKIHTIDLEIRNINIKSNHGKHGQT